MLVSHLWATARASLVLSDEELCPQSLDVTNVSHDSGLKHLPHGLLYLLEEDLRDPAAQGVDGVQELSLDGVKERLQHVVLKGKLQEGKTETFLDPVSFKNITSLIRCVLMQHC